MTDEKKGGLMCLLYSIVLSKGFYEYYLIIFLLDSFYFLISSLKYEMQDHNMKPLIDTNGKVSILLYFKIF